MNVKLTWNTEQKYWNPQKPNSTAEASRRSIEWQPGGGLFGIVLNTIPNKPPPAAILFNVYPLVF